MASSPWGRSDARSLARATSEQLPAGRAVGLDVFADTAVAHELLQVRRHGAGRDPVELDVDVGVDAGDALGDRLQAVTEGLEDLALTQHAMRDVLLDLAR